MKFKYFIFIVITFFLFNTSFAGIWTQKQHFGGDARHRATSFTVNGKGYTGLGHINSGQHITYDDFWEYDPISDTWTQKADFGGGQRQHATGFSIGDYGYVGLGRDSLDEYTSDFWEFDPIANTWTLIDSFPGDPRRGAASFVLFDEGYVGTGQTDNGYALDFFKYDPISADWISVAVFPGVARTGGVGLSRNGKGYVATGHTWGAALKDFWEYNPVSDTWTQKSDVGDTLRQDACGFVVNERAYVGTGNNVDGSINYGDIWEYDFDNDFWFQVDDFGGFKRRYMTSFVIDSLAYCGGGTDGTNFNDLWEFNQYKMVDVEVTKKSNIKVFPTLVSHSLTIENDKADNFMIIDVNGKIRSRKQISIGSNFYQLDNLSIGMYFIRFYNDDVLLKSQKIIVQK